jgi:polysaccharide pyruvyl transferase WcaK-like protein
VPTVILAGAFGQRNPGDEALLDAFVAAIPEDWDVIATATVPPHARNVETVSSDDSTKVARVVARADAVVFAGGTVFKELAPHTRRSSLDLLQKGAALAYGAKALGKRLAMVGVGAARIRHGRGQKLARRLVRQADLLVLRDEESADVLAGLGAPTPFRIGADPAWTLVESSTPMHAGAGDRVIVALSCEAGNGEVIDDLAAALVPLLAAGHEVALQPWQVGGPSSPDDLAIARALATRLGGTAEIMLPPADLADAVETYRDARLVLGLRFHALIAAAAAGRPFVAYAHEPKLAGVARRLGQPAVAPERAVRDLGPALVAAAARPTPPAIAAIRSEIARADESMRLLRLVLSNGEADEPESIGTLPLKPAEWAS